MDQIMMATLLVALIVVSWAVNRKDMSSGRLARKPVPVEKDRIERRKTQ